jgi:hypothetical protein
MGSIIVINNNNNNNTTHNNFATDIGQAKNIQLQDASHSYKQQQ